MQKGMKKIKDFSGTVTISAEQIEKRSEQGILDLADEELDIFFENFRKRLLKYWLLTRPLVENTLSKKRFWERR
jgi:hypothetical protein